MALNHRRQGPISSENGPLNILPGKTAVTKDVTGLTKRQALGEIKNQIHNNREPLKKQPSINGQKSIITTTKSTTTTTLTQRQTNKSAVVETKPENKICIKKSSENLITKSIVNKIETACVIKNDEAKSYSAQRICFIEEEEDNVIGSDPQFVAEYTNDIFAYLHSLELKYPIDELFLAGHRTTSRMRCVLINWLVEVHINFKMLPETLHLCVQIVDRYLQKNKTVGRDNLQLVGITALWIASKYEEMYIPDINDFVYIGDESFTTEELKCMELTMIKALDYSFGRPLSVHFLRRYSKVSNADTEQHTLAKYLLELSLMNFNLSSVRPSLQAAAATFLSCSILNNCTKPEEIWTRVLIHYSTYKFSEILKTVQQMALTVVKAETSNFQSVRTKYASSSYGKISLYPELKGSVIRKYAQK